MKSPMQKPF